MKRIFAAFPITGDIAADFIQIAERDPGTNGIRWTWPANLHITLFFIGEVDEVHIDEIISRLKNKFSNIDPFVLNFSAIEVKYKKGRPGLIWAWFEKSEEFSKLSKQIEESVRDLMTIDPQHKDPIPHCTLARVKSFVNMDSVDIKFEKQFRVEVDHIELWMTVQEMSGVVYQRLL